MMNWRIHDIKLPILCKTSSNISEIHTFSVVHFKQIFELSVELDPLKKLGTADTAFANIFYIHLTMI